MNVHDWSPSHITRPFWTTKANIACVFGLDAACPVPAPRKLLELPTARPWSDVKAKSSETHHALRGKTPGCQLNSQMSHFQPLFEGLSAAYPHPLHSLRRHSMKVDMKVEMSSQVSQKKNSAWQLGKPSLKPSRGTSMQNHVVCERMSKDCLLDCLWSHTSTRREMRGWKGSSYMSNAIAEQWADTTEQFQMQISSGCAANLSSNVVVFPTPNAHLWRSLRSLSSSSLRPLQWMKTGTPPHRPPQGRFAYAASVYLRSTSKSWSNLVPWEESAPHLPPRANLKDLAQWMTTPPAWKSSNKERALDRFRIWCPPRTTWQHSLQQSLECKKCDLSVQLQILQEIRAAAVLLPVPSNSDTSAPGKCARRCRRCSRPWQHSFVGRSWGNAQTLWAARNKHGGWSSIRCQGRCSECNCSWGTWLRGEANWCSEKGIGNVHNSETKLLFLLAHTRPILIDTKIASNHGRMGQRFLWSQLPWSLGSPDLGTKRRCFR